MPSPSSVIEEGRVYRYHLGASRCAAWMGLVDNNFNEAGLDGRARDALIEEWSSPSQPSTGRPVPPQLSWGIDMEPRAAADYVALTGIDAASVARAPLRENRETRGLCSRPDYLVGDDGMLELKCPPTVAFGDDTHVTLLRTEWLLQVQVGLETFDRSYCDVVVWTPCYMWIWRVVREPTGPGLWRSLLPEYRKFQTAVDSDSGSSAEGTDPVTMRHIRSQLALFRKKHVKIVRVADGGDLAWAVDDEQRTNPTKKLHFIDRFANPTSQASLHFASRLLRVRWLNETTFWTQSGGKDDVELGGVGGVGEAPSGGFIRAEYVQILGLRPIQMTWPT